MSFGVLFVCTGNICRSPMAADLLRARLGEGSRERVRVSSAGTHAVVGHGLDQVAALALRDMDVPAAAHVAARMTARDAADAGLILTATSEHRREILADFPAAVTRTFTIREFARLGEDLAPLVSGSDNDELARRVAQVATRRGLRHAGRSGEDDIGDPFGAPLADMRRCAAQLDAAVSKIVAILGLAD